MKQLTVSFQDDLASKALSDIASRLRHLQKHGLSCVPWPAYSYKPEVTFSIAYSTDSLLLQFNVEEKFIKAAHGNINEPVYKDSCVEFFLNFDEGAAYYNFEFNCIGTALAGFGKEKMDRQFLPPQSLKKIKTAVQICREAKDVVKWEITLIIPFSVFVYHTVSSLCGQQCRANFYKCGDELPEPHFLSWMHIKSSEPNLHLPEFFGMLHFQ